MITLQKIGDAIKFTFSGNTHYLQDGTVEVPVNSLSLTIDDSGMATFRKSASNDIFISATYGELGMTKDELVAWYKENMVDGGGSDITSGDVQNMIDESISGKADSSAVTEEISAAVSGKQDTLIAGENITISGNVISAEGGVNVVQTTGTSTTDVMSQDAVTNQLNNKANKTAAFGGYSYGATNNQPYIQYKNVNNDNIGNGIYYPKINGKDTLTSNSTWAQNNLNFSLVETSAITSSITSASTDSQIPTAKAVYDALQEGGGSSYTAGDGIDITNDVISVTGKTDTTAFTAYTAATDTALASKQTTLTAGTGISIVDNVISATGGGGGKAIEAGRGISVTTGETADTVSFNLPISAGTLDYSIQEGQETSAMSYSDHAEGYNTYANGNGYAAHAEGYQTSAMTAATHAEGGHTKANGNYAHAEGTSTVASGYSSHAEGNGTNAYSDYSHTEGYYTSASSVSNVSGIDTYMGYQTRHAEGCNALANNASTHVEGYYTQANNFGEHASGVFNASNSATTTWGDSGNTLFSVGNGTGDNARHNAFEIRQNGDIYIADSNDTSTTNFYEKPMIKLQDTITATVANTTALGGLKLQQISQSDYDNLVTKDNSTLYVVTDS